MAVYQIGAVNLTSAAAITAPSYSATKAAAATRAAQLLSAASTAKPTAAAPVSTPSFTQSTFTPAPADDGPPKSLLIAGGVVAVLALGAVAYKIKKSKH